MKKKLIESRLAYHVLLNDELIDTVFFSDKYSMDYVRRSLIVHDKYPKEIQVKLAGEQHHV